MPCTTTQHDSPELCTATSASVIMRGLIAAGAASDDVFVRFARWALNDTTWCGPGGRENDSATATRRKDAALATTTSYL